MPAIQVLQRFLDVFHIDVLHRNQFGEGGVAQVPFFALGFGEDKVFQLRDWLHENRSGSFLIGFRRVYFDWIGFAQIRREGRGSPTEKGLSLNDGYQGISVGVPFLWRKATPFPARLSVYSRRTEHLALSVIKHSERGMEGR